MNAVPFIKTAAALAACCLAAGCGTPVRQVSRTAVLDQGTVACRSQRVIWESSDIAHGCDVTIKYRGTDKCPARLLTVPSAAAGTTDQPPPNSPPAKTGPGQTTEPAGAAEVTVKLRKVQSLWLACGGPGGEASSGECSYTIERVNSSRTARVLHTTIRANIPLASVVAGYGETAQTVWESPAAPGGNRRGCHVSLRVKGSAQSHAVVQYTQANGRVRQLVVDDRGELVTLSNVVKINLSCSRRGSEPCTAEVVQTDCPE